MENTSKLLYMMICIVQIVLTRPATMYLWICKEHLCQFWLRPSKRFGRRQL